MKFRDRLFRVGLPIVDHVARRVSRRARGRMELEDLQSVGKIALLQLARRYTPGRVSFPRYSARRLRWAMLDALRRETHGRCVGPIRTKPAERSSTGSKERGHSPARSPSALRQGRGLIVTFRADVGPVADRAEGPESIAAREEVMRKVKPMLRDLDERQRVLIQRHYLGSERLDRIAEDLGISKSWASRLARQAVNELAERLGVRPRKRGRVYSPRTRAVRLVRRDRIGSGPSSSLL